MVLTEIQALFSLSNSQVKSSADEVLHAFHSFLQELDGLVEISELDRAVDGDLGVLEGVYLHM